MAIRISFAGASLLEPGSYSDTQVIGSNVSNPALGVVALIGEANEGSPFAAETGLDAVTYSPDELSVIVEKYGSGELVDAASLVISPSNDPQIQGGAQEIILLKTNASVAAHLDVGQGENTFGTITAKSAGVPGNSISYGCSVVDSQAIITISNLTSGISEVSDPIGGGVGMTLQCTDSDASAATVTVTDKLLTTTVTGGSTAQNLSLTLANFNTISQIVSYINSQPGYTATAPSSQVGNKPPSVLDQISSQNIKTSYSLLKDLSDIEAFFAKSSLVSFTAGVTSGVPTAMSRTFLSGGTLGATSASSILDCLDALMKRRVNFIVPLFSRDATADISDGLTDASSNYTIDAVHAGIVSHVNLASTVKGRKERMGFVGFKGNFADSKEQSGIVNAARVQMLFQDVLVSSISTGLIETKQPHMLAALAAGMKAAAPVGLSNTFKQPLIQGFSHVDFDPETMGEQAIEANLCYVEKTPQGGFRFKLDNSTYSSDLDSWVYNRPSVLYAADVCAYAIRLNTEIFVGQRNSDVNAQTISSQLVSVFDSLKSLGCIVGDANTKGLGYKDLSVRISGSIVEVDVTLALVENLEFVLNTVRIQRAG